MNQYVYDAYGQLLSRIDGAGTVQEEHTYCRDGERVSSRYADGNELRYTYGMNDLEAAHPEAAGRTKRYRSTSMTAEAGSSGLQMEMGTRQAMM